MKWRFLKQRFNYYRQFFPFTINSVVFIALLFLAYHILYKPKPADDPAPFLPFVILMAKLVVGFLLALVAFSVLSTFFCFLWYLWQRKKKHHQLQLQFQTNTQGLKNKLFIHASLPGAIRPILGFINAKLLYDGLFMTDSFSLLSSGYTGKSFWRTGIKGKSRLILPDIKEYELKGAFIYFQDMLHLFRLTAVQPLQGHFYQAPLANLNDEQEVFPKNTESLYVRIDQLRRVDGEHLNYKDFEAGDDVRRIVWKVYAKNRELLVRIPELFEPYASHLYFYASFYSNEKQGVISTDYSKEMLNYFKNYCWAVYKSLSAQQWEMRYIADQHFALAEQLDNEERNARIISNSNWQSNTKLSEYFNPKKGSVLCISSFTNPDDLNNILDACDAATVVYFIKTSRVFKHWVALSWLSKLFFIPAQDRLSKLRAKWYLSPKRLQIIKQEKAIMQVLKNSKVNYTVL